ncbi:MAG: prephenate dehydrogenase/arogenate dehydrogenase family protein [Negativicutes bacterium]|nr:prephenate dehydrogenase/arogenate dehydrogenase family protein [Negativicutes bacterium]
MVELKSTIPEKNLTIAIFGLGLIGSSLAQAFKRHTNHTVKGFARSERVRKLALEMKALDFAPETPELTAEDADILIFCVPPAAMVESIRQALPKIKPGAIITDVASIKGQILEEIPPLLPDHVTFVGGHPMAGSEKGGFENGDPDLFIDRPFLFLTHSTSPQEVLRVLEEMAKQIGARPILIPAEAHDRAAAEISHASHVIASLLVLQAAHSPGADWNFQMAAGGFRDMTRVASGNPELWTDICLANREEIALALESLENWSEKFRHALKNQDSAAIQTWLAEAAEIRNNRFHFPK